VSFAEKRPLRQNIPVAKQPLRETDRRQIGGTKTSHGKPVAANDPAPRQGIDLSEKLQMCFVLFPTTSSLFANLIYQFILPNYFIFHHVINGNEIT